MTKNMKSIFFVLTLVTLLATVGAVCAADDTNSTAVDSSVIDVATVSDSASDTVAAEPTTTSNDNKVDTKTIEKEDKNLKTATKTIEVNNMNELRSTITSAVNDAENDEYIINLNEGTYSSTVSSPINSGSYTPSMTINGNHQTITGTKTMAFRNGCNITFNQLIFENPIRFTSMNITLNQITSTNTINFQTGILTVNNSVITKSLTTNGITTIENSQISSITNSGTNSTIIIKNSTTTDTTNNQGTISYENTTINSKITNTGTIIISDNSIIGENFYLSGSGTVIINDTNKIAEFLLIYNGDYTLTSKVFDTEKTNLQNLTLVDCNVSKKLINEGKLNLRSCIINSTINNTGIIYVDEDTIFGENAQIIGLGDIITTDITRLLPYIETLTGNYTITDTTLDKTYNFNGNITLKNCNITSTDNVNYGILNLVNSNVQVDEEANWITNYGLITIDEQSTTTGQMTDYGETFTGSLPEDYTYDPTYHIINNDTIIIYFDTTKGNVLSKLVNEGDTLDFQGTISGVTGLGSLVINKPVNIITSTNDGRIENFGSITYNSGASGSNVTGLYTYNTQFYVRNAHNMVFDNISNVVISKGIGWGVGQTSIRENSTNITVKNSYFYTKDNGGSSTFVFGWADNCTLINSTIETDGNVGNLVYLTTYNVDVPSGTIANSYNQILNNIIIGPETPMAICWGIVLSGANNYIANNVIYYSGTGITNQWGSGITGQGEDNNETSLVTIENNTLHNNTHIKHKPQNELIIDTTAFTAGETTTITASIYFTNKINTNITKGKVSFKVNGKTLKDENGKVIYVKVINGTATIENYIVPEDWAKEGSTIQAVYSGSTQCAKLTSEKTNITVTPEETTLTITPLDTATPGQTTTLTATLSDNTINTGKIVFKINGKTVKDANGKVIYAKVVNGTVSVDYTLPESYKAGTYTVTATFIASGYDKLETNTTMTVEN